MSYNVLKEMWLLQSRATGVQWLAGCHSRAVDRVSDVNSYIARLLSLHNSLCSVLLQV